MDVTETILRCLLPLADAAAPRVPRVRLHHRSIDRTTPRQHV